MYYTRGLNKSPKQKKEGINMLYLVTLPVLFALLAAGAVESILIKTLLLGFAGYWAMTVGLTYASNIAITTAKKTKAIQRAKPNKAKEKKATS